MIFQKEKFSQNSTTGFTIPELLVSVFVIVLMTAIIVPSWRAGEMALALDRAAHKLGQDVRHAQELALRAQPFTCSIGSMSGYGVFFNEDDPDSYILFAECNGNNAYNAGTDGLVQSIPLEAGISIQNVFPALPTTIKEGSVVFLPPIPAVMIMSGTTSPIARPQMVIVLQRKDNSALTKRITIKGKGIVDID